MLFRSLCPAALLVAMTTSVALATAQKDLDDAAKHGKVAFILVTDQGATGVDEARQTIRAAMKEVKKSTLVELDRSRAENAELVAKFRLAGAPVPLILVTARNGVLAAGGPAAEILPEKLISLVPSPKQGEVLQALQAGKSVFIAASRKSMDAQARAAAACATACAKMNQNSAVVAIDMDDPAEAPFLQALKINPTSAQPVTVVVNPQGQLTGTFRGIADTEALVQAATRKAGGCCPSTVQGGSKSCAPAK